MTVQVNTRVFDELSNTIQELETLTSKPGNLTSKEDKRHAFLLAKMAMLRSGVDVTSLRNYEMNRVLSEIGHQLPAQCNTVESAEREAEMRKWLFTSECKSTSRPSDEELRYTGQLAGQQTLLYSKENVGGGFVPTDFASRSFDVQADYDNIMAGFACTLLDTTSGSLYPVPSIDDTKNAATILGEATQGSEVTVANFSQRTLGAFKYASGILALSIELSEEGAFPWSAVLEKLFSIRMARGVSKSLLTGTGVNQPTGLQTSIVSAGVNPIISSGSANNDGSANSSSNSLGSADLVKCLHALDRAYRRNCVFAMSDDTLSFLEQIVTKEGLPLVSFRKGSSDVDGEWPYILGRRVATCPSMADIAPTSIPVLCYDPAYWVVRRVPSSLYLQVFRQAPGLVENGLIGVQMYGRYDGTLVATQNASKCPASFIMCHS